MMVARTPCQHLIDSAKEEDKPLKSSMTNEIITPNMIPNCAFDDLLGEIDDVIRAKAAKNLPLKADYISLISPSQLSSSKHTNVTKRSWSYEKKWKTF